MTQTPPPQDPYSQVPPPGYIIAATPKAVGLATVALVLGICAFIPCLGFIAAPIAVILAIVALAIGTTAKGRAIAGLVTAVAGLMIMIGVMLLSSILFPSLSKARELAKRAVCSSNLNAIGMEIALYHAENEDAFPPTLQHLIDAGQPSKMFTCPSADGERAFDYFYFPATNASPDNAMMACDFKDNHRNYRNVLFVDFSISSFTEQEFQDALQEPQNAAFAAALAGG